MGGSGRAASAEGATQIELALDFAVFEDGLCAGPDETGLFEVLNEDVARQREATQEIVAALHGGASVGRVFDVLRPLAQHRVSHARRERPLLTAFANIAIHRLVDTPDSDLLNWFEQLARSSPLQLHRASRPS